MYLMSVYEVVKIAEFNIYCNIKIQNLSNVWILSKRFISGSKETLQTESS